MKITSIVGARPNFMKIAPLIQAINKHNQIISDELDSYISHTLIHTGQHYDDKMSKSFFQSLNIPEADINLGIGSGTHAEQVGYTMMKLEKEFEKEKPDWVIVVGDVNATLAASITAKKLHINVCHIEAGLRSGDMEMPEEINRIVTDRLSDLLLTPDDISSENLRKEGVPEEKIKFVGNIMIDTLEANREKAASLDIKKIIKANLLNGKHELTFFNQSLFTLLTIHRPSNVDEKNVFEPIIDFLINEVTNDIPLIWPIHPRAKKRLQEFGLWKKVENAPNIILTYPLGYHDMLRLNMNAKMVLTDSGGLQEECTVLGTPCLTMRWNTERPATLCEFGGTSVLVGNEVQKIRDEYYKTIKLNRKPNRPVLWDGKTAERCVEVILNTKQ